MKKILIFSTAYKPLVGGAEVAVEEIAKRLAADHLIFLITYRFDTHLPAIEHDGALEIHRLGYGTLLDRWFLFPFLAFWKARELHKRHNLSLLWGVMVSYASVGAYLLKLFHPRLPLLLTLQEGDPERHLLRGKLGLLGVWWKLLVKKADYIQAISSYLADFALARGARNKIAIVPNGVNLEHFSTPSASTQLEKYRRFFGFAEADFIIITVSRLVKKNAVDIVIESLKFLPANFKLLIVGGGERHAQLRALVSSANLESRAIFTGQVSHAELPDYLHLASVFARPSRSEGLGVAFLEACAAGVPVVATLVGGIKDFLRDGKTGLVCRPDDPYDLAEKIKLLAGDLALRQALSQNAQKLMAERYTWEHAAQSLKSIINELT